MTRYRDFIEARRLQTNIITIITPHNYNRKPIGLVEREVLFWFQRRRRLPRSNMLLYQFCLQCWLCTSRWFLNLSRGRVLNTVPVGMVLRHWLMRNALYKSNSIIVMCCLEFSLGEGGKCLVDKIKFPPPRDRGSRYTDVTDSSNGSFKWCCLLGKTSPDW